MMFLIRKCGFERFLLKKKILFLGESTRMKSEQVPAAESSCLSFWYVKYGESGNSGKMTVRLVSFVHILLDLFSTTSVVLVCIYDAVRDCCLYQSYDTKN